MLVHVAGGCEESVTDVALVSSRGLRITAGPTSVNVHSMNSLEVDIEVAGLGVAAATEVAGVRPLLGVCPHVALEEAGHMELPVTGGAPEAGGEGGGRGHAGGASLGHTVSHTLRTRVRVFCLPFSFFTIWVFMNYEVMMTRNKEKNKLNPKYTDNFIST